ncbi:membrane-bound lytic murein transglycosylase MltF [Alteromonas sp. CYL-A6]|uniref:membrane-bound lytic murein transglycosylase MltF n=1 Tax=Alteromonas nitratireducens TaxID=3390813 RepID=UPI0034AB3F65
MPFSSQRLFLPLLLLGFMACLIAGCKPPEQKNALTALTERNVLKVGTLYGPATYYNGPNGPVGFEYELLAGFADYLNVELEIYPFYSYQMAAEQLANGQLDVIATGDAIAEDEAGVFVYGPPYLHVDQHLVFKNGGPRPQALTDLNEPVVVVAASSQARLLRQALGTADGQRWTESHDADAEELLQQVASDELTYTLADSNKLAMQRRRFPNLSVAFTLSRAQPVAWAVSPQTDDSLRAAMVAYFGLTHQSGRFKALEDKYFGHIRQFDFVDTRAFIRATESVLPKFDSWFKRYAGDIDWRLLAAMSYQESHWDPKATSPTGVRGLMMLTRDTAKDWDVASRTDAQQSIRGGARYFSSLKSRIPARIQDPDRTWMALAAYNIGLGHLEDARVLTQRQGGNPDLWVDVKQRLPLLRQKRYYRQTRFGYARGDEALRYVENIRRYYDTLRWLDEQQSATNP